MQFMVNLYQTTLPTLKIKFLGALSQHDSIWLLSAQGETLPHLE